MLQAIGNITDSALSIIAPTYAAKRMHARAVIKQLATFAAAERGRSTKSWKTTTKTADEAIIPDLPLMTARARDLCRDNSHARSIVRSFGRNVVGRGITPESAIEIATDDPAMQELDEQLDRLWELWATTPAWCDVEGRRTFYDMQRVASEQLVEAGEAFFVMSMEGNAADGMVPLKLQFIEAEQLDPSITKDVNTGNAIVGGVEIDDKGRPVAYHIRPITASPSGRQARGYQAVQSYANDPVRYEADRVLHVYRPDRAGQVRGYTWLAPVLIRLHNLQKFDDAYLWAAQLEASIGVIIKRVGANSMIGAGGGSGLNAPLGSDNVDEDGNREFNFRPGMVAELEPGEDVTAFNPQRPSGVYEAYTMAQLKSIAAGVDLSYPQVSRDFHQGNFSSQRQAKLEDERAWQSIQDLLIASLCRPVRNAFVRLASSFDIVPGLPSPEELRAVAGADYLAADWMPDGWAWVEPVREAQAEKIAVEELLDTRGAVLNRRGRSFRKVVRAAKRERQMLDEAGLQPLAERKFSIAEKAADEAAKQEDDEDIDGGGQQPGEAGEDDDASIGDENSD